MTTPALASSARVLGAVLSDVALVGAGATVLWLNGGETVVSGSAAGIVVFEAVSIALLSLRLVLLNSGRGRRRSGEIRRERWTATVDILLLAGIQAAWFATHIYFLGWVATLASTMLLLGSAFQLMVDVTTGRNARPRREGNAVNAHRFTSLEVQRLIVGVTAIAGMVLTTPVHGWQSVILNPLAVLIAVAMGSSVALRSSVRGLRRRRASQDLADR